MTPGGATQQQATLNAYDDDMVALSDQAIDWLVRLQSEDATSDDYVAFTAWRGKSDKHARAVRDAEALMGAVDETRAAQGWISFETVSPNRRGGAAHRRMPSRSTAQFGFARKRAAMAVMSICAVLLLVIVGGIHETGIWNRWSADYSTNIGQYETVKLPDGSVAHMNTASAFSIDYSAGVRRIHLAAGEVIFDVAKDASHPFIVSANGGEAMAVGTVYGVRIDQGATKVTVREGIVEVRNGDGNSLRLVAGGQATYRNGSDPTVSDNADFSAYGSWQRGKLIFNSQPLGDVIDEVQRYKAGRIMIARDDLRGLKVTGVFATTDVDDLLLSLEQTTRAHVLKLPLITVIY